MCWGSSSSIGSKEIWVPRKACHKQNQNKQRALQQKVRKSTKNTQIETKVNQYSKWNKDKYHTETKINTIFFNSVTVEWIIPEKKVLVKKKVYSWNFYWIKMFYVFVQIVIPVLSTWLWFTSMSCPVHFFLNTLIKIVCFWSDLKRLHQLQLKFSWLFHG